MKPILFVWGPLMIPAYGFFIGLGVVLCMALAERRGRILGLPRFAMLDGLMLATLGGIIGAELLHFAFSGGNPGNPSGRSFFGGILTGTVASLAFMWWRRIPLLKFLDTAFLFAPLGHALGRIGCWFYGCCHGSVCRADFPLAVWYPKVEIGGGRIAGSPAFVRHVHAGLLPPSAEQSLPVYPTQLVSALLLAGVFLALLALAKRPAISSRAGSLFCLYLVLSGAARFAEEFIREHTRYWGLLTNAQIVSLLLMGAGGAGLWWLAQRDEPQAEPASA